MKLIKKIGFLIITSLYITILDCHLFSSSKILEPYKSINILPLDSHGWFSAENRNSLKHFITTYKPKVVVELGSWLGLSAIFMASLLPSNSVLYAIDNWTAEGDEAILNNEEAKLKIPTLYQQFLSNVIHTKLTHKIIPMRMSTIEAAQSLNIHADLIYIDASHDEKSVYNDIIHWHPKLNKGGIMCGDDWLWASVQTAVKRASSELNLAIKSNGNFWYFE
ncbi:class I SAM-dependent methyltransferase [Candidatus Dependentiae bacterium]|nr:class I SAM-dependent methyltransferase [Candidatus Dependentiae bacterium]